MGNKGATTRNRILKATAELMERRPIRDLKVAEIGALAGLSSSTFYIYFESVSEAALAVVEGLHQATPEIMSILDQEWTRENVHDEAKKFVKSYMHFWDRHHAVLRVRNFVADEGDRKFFDARRRSIEPIHLALQMKMMAFHGDNPDRLHPPSTVSVLMAMLERTAAIIRLPSAHQARRPRQIESAAFLLASAMLGPAAIPAKGGRTARRRVTDKAQIDA
jgi:AcrR family transcriptional regulator